MKLLIAPILLIFGTADAEFDLSDVKGIVAPGFEAVHASFDPKITGGMEAQPHSFPHQVGLFISMDDSDSAPGFCGGSLITPMYVLTAAHCCVISDNIVAVLGAHRIKEPEKTQLQYNVSKVIVHKKYNDKVLVNDICLLQLPEAVPLSDVINVVTLPKHSQRKTSFKGKLATASGWGKDSDKATSISEVLRFVNFKVISNFECGLRYPAIVKSTHLCTNGAKGRSTCNGDSGGALVIDKMQIGVTSFGIALGCQFGWPPAFTRVSRYLDWIEENSDAVIQK